MKLYMTPLAPNVRRVRLTAAALELPLEELPLNLARGEHKRPEYLALNPNGAVPTLVDGDLVLTESRAIMQYLASKRPDSALLPRDESDRADVVRWQFWDASHFSPQLGTLAFETVIKPLLGMGEPLQSKLDEAMVQLRRFCAVLHQRLEGRKYLVGAALTIADLTLASSLMYAGQTNVPLEEFPHVQAWFSRISHLSAWKKTDPF
jgi:glutathione S-transferase